MRVFLLYKLQQTPCFVKFFLVIDVPLTRRLNQVNIVDAAVQQLRQDVSVGVNEHLKIANQQLEDLSLIHI